MRWGAGFWGRGGRGTGGSGERWATEAAWWHEEGQKPAGGGACRDGHADSDVMHITFRASHLVQSACWFWEMGMGGRPFSGKGSSPARQRGLLRHVAHRRRFIPRDICKLMTWHFLSGLFLVPLSLLLAPKPRTHLPLVATPPHKQAASSDVVCFVRYAMYSAYV